MDTMNDVVDRWIAQQETIQSSLHDTFVRHAIDNRGILMSPRRGSQVVSQLFNLFIDFINGRSSELDVSVVTVQFAEQGMAFVTASRLLNRLSEVLIETAVDPFDKPLLKKINDFQTTFMLQFANARELLQQRIQENSQTALQHALQNQLEQQRISQYEQMRRNQSLNQILQLNTGLAIEENHESLLSAAANGLCQALDLTDVSIFGWRSEALHWRLLATSARPPEEAPTVAQLEQVLETAVSVEDPFIHPTSKTDEHLILATPLGDGLNLLGALVVRIDVNANIDADEHLILIRTFSQNLASLWHNINLLTASQQQTREMAILHGRFLDSIWRSENTWLDVSYTQGNLHPTNNHTHQPSRQIPLAIGEQLIGEIEIPLAQALSAEDSAFVKAVVNEMSEALNNAHLIQTTRAYSNQLTLAAEVSRTATTHLDREELVQAVVELIRSHFGFYYVGLFLVDEDRDRAILEAGTGDAGKAQIKAKHQHVLGGSSMISAAIVNDTAVVEPDVTLAKNFVRNSLLPETRSEAAIPLRTRGHIIGALTVQSSEKDAFSTTAVIVLQSMADQLAIAIENATLLAQTQYNLTETNRLYETAGLISKTSNPNDVFAHLLDFAQNSGLADSLYVLATEQRHPNEITCPLIWTRQKPDSPMPKRLPIDFHPFFSQIIHADSVIQVTADQEDMLDDCSRKIFNHNSVRVGTYIPIRQGNDWHATIALLTIDGVPPTPSDLQTFVTLTDQAAAILTNQELLAQAESLYRIGRTINQAITREDAIRIAIREVNQYLGAAVCHFVVYNYRQGNGTVITASPQQDFRSTLTVPMKEDFVFKKLSETRTPLMLSKNEEVPPQSLQQHVTQFGADLALLIPSSNQQEVMGYLAIGQSAGKRPLKASHVIFAQTIIDHLTTQIENIKLLDEALSRAQELVTLNQIQSNISTMLHIEGLAHTVYQQVGRLLKNDIFVLALYTQDDQQILPVLVMQDNEPLPTLPYKIPSDSSLHQFLRSDLPLIADEQHPLLLEQTAQFSTKVVKSGIWVPLKRNTQTIGLMAVQSYQPQAFNNNDSQLLRSIATQTSLAITNAQLFETIEDANKQLRQLDQLKTQFLANMSHELRTPLNSIIGFSRVILKGIDGPITPDQEEDLNSIHSNGQHLLMLINEILDMAKIGAGKMSLSFETTNLTPLADIAIDTVRGLIDESRVTFTWNVPDNLPPLEADPIRIRQVLINLLSNAVKYTEQGFVRLNIRHLRDHLQIEVKDSGIGIAEEDFEKVFADFEQVDNSTTRSVGGTGLGLPITKWIVEMHNGRIWFDTALHVGTTFYVSLPLQQPKPDTHPNQDSTAAEPERIQQAEQGHIIQ